MATIQCPSCHRIEQWNADNPVIITQQGGARRPSVHPQLSAWRILYQAHLGRTGKVVGRCAACEQPMVAQQDGPPALQSWELTINGNAILVTATEVNGPNGIMSFDGANTWLEDTLRTRIAFHPVDAITQTVILSIMTVPFLIWIGTISMFSLFIYATYTGEGISGVAPIAPIGQ